MKTRTGEEVLESLHVSLVSIGSLVLEDAKEGHDALYARDVVQVGDSTNRGEVAGGGIASVVLDTDTKREVSGLGTVGGEVNVVLQGHVVIIEGTVGEEPIGSSEDCGTREEECDDGGRVHSALNIVGLESVGNECGGDRDNQRRREQEKSWIAREKNVSAPLSLLNGRERECQWANAFDAKRYLSVSW